MGRVSLCGVCVGWKAPVCSSNAPSQGAPSTHSMPARPPACRHVGGAPCGCCYAFGGIAGVEAANALYTGGQLTTLSEQEIVDCDGLDYGCDGGWVEWVEGGCLSE